MNTQNFEQKYLQLTPRLYSVAFSVLGNAEDAEDAVQDTFARLWEKRNELERMENAEGYFMPTLRHISLNMLRNRRVADNRAKNVYDYLVKCGVNPKQLTYEGKGNEPDIYKSNQKANRAVIVK